MKVQTIAAVVLLSSFSACRTVAPPVRVERSEITTELAAVRAVLATPSVVEAQQGIERDREWILAEWRRLTEIPAPSGSEQARAEAVEDVLRTIASLEVTRDEVGNVIAVRRGSSPELGDVVLDAHLDTVFAKELDVTTSIRNGRLYAPGVGDNTRNVVALLAIARALDAANVRTKKDIVFSFTVEEETNFRGIHHFLEQRKGTIDAFVALDGGFSGFTYGGIGTNWYRHHFIGPGGHTRSRTPPYSAALPLARAIERIYQLPVPENPPTNLNVGMLGGAAVVNAKASDAWMSLDLRSTSNEVIDDLERRIARILEEEAARAGMTVKTEVISRSRAAQIEGHRHSPMVKTAEAVHWLTGFEDPHISPTASNHASPALRAGVHAISTGVAPCDDAHAVTENCEIEPIRRGIRKILILGIALAELAP